MERKNSEEIKKKGTGYGDNQEGVTSHENPGQKANVISRSQDCPIWSANCLSS